VELEDTLLKPCRSQPLTVIRELAFFQPLWSPTPVSSVTHRFREHLHVQPRYRATYKVDLLPPVESPAQNQNHRHDRGNEHFVDDRHPERGYVTRHVATVLGDPKANGLVSSDPQEVEREHERRSQSICPASRDKIEETC
jgi:hypothetical protein